MSLIVLALLLEGALPSKRTASVKKVDALQNSAPYGGEFYPLAERRRAKCLEACC